MSDYLSSPIRQMMYQNMLANLSNGIISPLDKDIISYAPLPDSVIDPYIKRETDPLQMMNLTNNALRLWVEESKKASYFTKHFVTLSRMIMNGVATMARGLVTLHMRGEDLDQAPLSIQELISISSCQFRKSYLGVLQTVKSHPEISARLLENQLSWNNTLLKLFKTKEKLAKPLSPVEIRETITNDQISDSGDRVIPELAQASALTAQPAELPQASSLEIQEEGLSGFSALSEPAAYGAVHAYGPLSDEKEPGGKREKLPRPCPPVTLPAEPEPEQPALDAADEQTVTEDPQITAEAQAEPSREEDSAETDETQDPSASSDIKPQCAEPLPPDTNSGQQPRPDHPPGSAGPPDGTSCRSGPLQDEKDRYTFEQMREFLANPGFCYFEPKKAAEFRKILDSLDEET